VRKLIDSGRGFIMAVWHGRTLLPIHYCRKMGIWAITSLSRDGEIQSRVVRLFGYRTVRGSSFGGAVRAAVAACKKLEEGGILAITPDGPRGPAMEVQEGIVFMARRVKCPIVPIGAAANKGWLMPAWDSFLVPFPFSRCAIVFGEPITLPENQESDDESAELLVKNALDSAQRQAEEIVAGRGG